MSDPCKVTEPAMSSNDMQDQNSEDSSDKRNNQVKQKRFKLLKDALDKVFTKVATGKLSWYTKQFPALQAKDPGILKLLREQVTHQLESTIKMEVETMLEEENLMEIMKDLNQRIKSTKAQKTDLAWRPTGNVDDDIRAHLMPVKMKLRDNLQTMLSKLEEENKQLQTIVCERQKNLIKAEQKLKDYNGFFEKIAVSAEVIMKSSKLSEA
ncbi:polyamine-modulated factor 1 [Octopus bimaculoides]|uniref:Uncharacterized protein n=1 Tax=Octopus bimaculoides TaxID=37653 RepID=A0A0L8HI50_OCTBM|nr:polyamine-modulated factor 1 [Octopus bimaculoides]|eukprot:XP_014772421.1 PREDICTED: polyamine-modulated factor 1-like [Octopus bimaculoides]